MFCAASDSLWDRATGKKKINYQPRCGADQSNLFCMPWLQTSCQASQSEIENLHPAEEKVLAYWLNSKKHKT